MTRDKIFIFLQSDIFSFTFPQDLVKKLARDFPHYSVEDIGTEDEFTKRIAEPKIVVTWRFQKELYEKAKNLEAILTPSAGKEWIDQDPTGRVQCHFGSYHGYLLGESLVLMMLYLNRMFPAVIENQRNRVYDRNLQEHTPRLTGQNVLIAGYGYIGKHLVEFLQPFNCIIKGLQREVKNGFDTERGVEYITDKDLPEALAWADHVVDILPATPETEDFFGRNEFLKMKKSAYFYNVGRGHTCNEGAIVEALETGEIAGAALDVFKEEPLPKDSKLWNTKNLLITPHSSCIFHDYMYLYYEELRETLLSLRKE
jgi:phosphoglycerate dehydrogenase-like enzyme